MAIELNDNEAGTRTPVLRKRRLGEAFIGALVKLPERRDSLKRNPATGADEPQIKPSGKARQELVVTMVTMPGTTMPAGLGDDESVPAPGDIVRVILKGGGYGDWIEADKALKPRNVGDVISITSTTAQVYDGVGQKSGGEITDQASVDAARAKGKSVGIYGPLTIRRADPTTEAAWIAAAEAAYHEATAITLPDDGDIFAN